MKESKSKRISNLEEHQEMMTGDLLRSPRTSTSTLMNWKMLMLLVWSKSRMNKLQMKYKSRRKIQSPSSI